jgi:imidazolonepropionase-like amidohydrolase
MPESPPRVVLIEDVAVLDVASGRRQTGRDVLIEDGVITALGPTGSIPAPEGADVRSYENATVLPGLVDMHGHVDANGAAIWEQRLPDHDANLAAFLYCGVTTVFDPGDASSGAFSRRDAVASGKRLGPRIYTAGPILTAEEGHPIALVRTLAPWWIAWWLAPRVAMATGSPEAAVANVDALVEKRPDAIKIVIDAIPLGAPRMSREVAAAVVERAAENDLRVVAHVGTTEDAIDAAEAGVAAWMHAVYKERIPDDQIAKLASYGIPVVATIEVFDRYGRPSDGPRPSTKLERETVARKTLEGFHPVPDDFDTGPFQSWLDLMSETFEARRDNVRRLHRAGVTILAGSDPQSGVFPGAGLHRELHHLVEAGLTPAQAIRAATLDGATFLANGAEPEFGIVAVGKRADLLLVEGDPTKDVGALENVIEVYKDGVALERTPVDNGRT